MRSFVQLDKIISERNSKEFYSNGDILILTKSYQVIVAYEYNRTNT